jgi:hypothetical protein
MYPDTPPLIEGWLRVLAVAFGILLPLTFVYVLVSTQRAPQGTGAWSWTARVRRDGQEARNFGPWGAAFGVACIGALLQSRLAAILACGLGLVFILTSARGIFHSASRDRMAKALIILACAAFVAGLALRLYSTRAGS